MPQRRTRLWIGGVRAKLRAAKKLPELECLLSRRVARSMRLIQEHTAEKLARLTLESFLVGEEQPEIITKKWIPEWGNGDGSEGDQPEAF